MGVSHRVGVDHHDAVVAAYLGSGKTYALARIHSLVHIGHELGEIRIIGGDRC